MENKDPKDMLLEDALRTAIDSQRELIFVKRWLIFISILAVVESGLVLLLR